MDPIGFVEYCWYPLVVFSVNFQDYLTLLSTRIKYPCGLQTPVMDSTCLTGHNISTCNWSLENKVSNQVDLMNKFKRSAFSSTRSAWSILSSTSIVIQTSNKRSTTWTPKKTPGLFFPSLFNQFWRFICQKENINQVKYHVVVNKISIQIFYLRNPMSLSWKNTSLISTSNFEWHIPTTLTTIIFQPFPLVSRNLFV